MTKDFFIDIHCHPTLKPFGKLISNNYTTNNKNNTSLWYYNPPNLGDILLENILGFSKYSQSNLTASAYGEVHILGVSLYAPEVSFFKNKLGTSVISAEIENIITEFGVKRINQIESKNYNYFNDLLEQIEYLKFYHNKTTTINNQKYKTFIISSMSDLENFKKPSDCINIALMLNIEGGHSLGCGKDPINNPADESYVLSNLDKIKNCQFKPLYITLAHHFYNELCGHAKSIPPPVDKLLDQKYGLDTDFTNLGIKVLHKLLDNTNKKRINIDIKHLSKKSRIKYFDILKTDYASQNIPIIFSHGGVTGLKNYNDKGTSQTLFNTWDINLFDDEIILLAKSKGLFGLNFDQRIMGSENTIKEARNSFSRHKKLYNWSKLIWNNIEHIATILDKNNLPSWDNICLGTDYDGIINPINKFWTEEEMPTFADYLNMHAFNFMKKGILSKQNLIESEDIIDRVMRINAFNFMKNNF